MNHIIVEVSKEEAHRVLDKVAKFITERRLGTIGILLIESLRPLNFIASQFMYMIAPFAELIFKPEEYQKLACALEDKENVAYLLKKIDKYDSENQKKWKQEKKRLKEIKKKKKELKKRLKNM